MDKRLRTYGGEITAEDFLKDEFRMNMKEIERRLKAVQSQIGTTSTSSTTVFNSGALVFVGTGSTGSTSFVGSHSYYNTFGQPYAAGWTTAQTTGDYLVEISAQGNGVNTANDAKIFGYIGKNGSDLQQFTISNHSLPIIGEAPNGFWIGKVSLVAGNTFNVRFYSAGTFQGVSYFCVKVTKL